MIFSEEALERYARHLILPEIGGMGQQRLAQARVLVIGAGGLGAPLLMYLAAAGVGHIGIVDDDVVSLSNLQRQIIHDTPSIGQLKTQSAAARVQALNPLIHVHCHSQRIDDQTIMPLLEAYDVVADGSDNFATRYAVADAALALKRPLITAALGRFDATLTTLKGYETNAQGVWNPTYRCLFPEPPPAGTVAPCAEAGVLGALAGIMGSLMALETVRTITPFGEDLVGRLLMVDAMTMRFETIYYERNLPPPV